jgi:glycosyltransferase involved in cell wall biosynthesis
VTTAVTGVAEILTPGTDGFVVASGDQEEAIAACLRGLADPARREAVGRAARAVAERHSLDVFLERTLSLYEEVVALKRAASR